MYKRQAENFDGLLERLQRSFEAERRFTADASHELRTPVAVIKSACEYGRAYDLSLIHIFLRMDSL